MWIDGDGAADRRIRRLGGQRQGEGAAEFVTDDQRRMVAVDVQHALDVLADLLDIGDEIDAIVGQFFRLGKGGGRVEADDNRAACRITAGLDAIPEAIAPLARQQEDKAGGLAARRNHLGKAKGVRLVDRQMREEIEEGAYRDTCRREEADHDEQYQSLHLETVPLRPPEMTKVTSASANSGLRPPATAM